MISRVCKVTIAGARQSECSPEAVRQYPGSLHKDFLYLPLRLPSQLIYQGDSSARNEPVERGDLSKAPRPMPSLFFPVPSRGNGIHLDSRSMSVG